MVTFSVLTMLGLGFAAAVLLALASRVFFVKEDPRVTAALEILPGANCGGCGFAGCEGYAKAVVNDPNVPANRCCASPKEAIVALGELTGKTVAEAEPLVAMRRCDVYHGDVADKYEYEGIPSCAAATLLRGGTRACPFSCLGFGDCERACPFSAMKIVDGLACVNIGFCTGCGMCVQACPRDVLQLVPVRARVCIPCNTRQKGKSVMELCTAGCIKCGKCVRVCPAKAITIANDRITIDHNACLTYGAECGMACVRGCARKILRAIDLARQPDGTPIELPKEEKPARPKVAKTPKAAAVKDAAAAPAGEPAAKAAPAAEAAPKAAPAAGAPAEEAPAAKVQAPAAAPAGEAAEAAAASPAEPAAAAPAAAAEKGE